jgi:hypothetical protein
MSKGGFQNSAGVVRGNAVSIKNSLEDMPVTARMG